MKPWKLILFFIATFLLSYISTLGFDPSWDIPETIIMSCLTFYCSPYSVGIIYRYFKGFHKNKTELFIAISLIFMITCWFYDTYATIFLLGYYPPMAFSNIGLSPFFYVLAGMMWSLSYEKDYGVNFLYCKNEWVYYSGGTDNFQKIFLWTLPMIIFMGVIFGFFIYVNI